MMKIELVLRTTDSSGVVEEQILTKFHSTQFFIEQDPILQYSGLCIDEPQHLATYRGENLYLTEKYEFQTLVHLARKPGWVYTREQIYRAVWKEEPVEINSAVACVISNIRKKLRKYTQKEYIQTVWGIGYKFVDVPGE